MQEETIQWDMLRAATKRAHRAAGRRIRWAEARRRARIWCLEVMRGEVAATDRQVRP